MAIKGRQILNGIEILEVDSEPNYGGAPAPVGSLAILTNGTAIYVKQGAADTAWGVIPSTPSGEQFEDFNFSTLGGTTNQWGVASVVANGATVTLEGASTANDYCGMVTLATGTTNNGTGRATADFFNSVNKIRFGLFKTFWEARVEVPTLSGTPTYQLYVGLQNVNTTGLPSNGVFFHYSSTVNSGNWRAVCSNASTRTNVDSTIPVVASQWYKLSAEINAAGTEVRFYVDGALIGSAVTTNIPASSVAMRPMIKIEKSSTSTTSRTSNVDYFYWRVER